LGKLVGSNFVSVHTDSQKTMMSRLKSWILLNVRVVKYGVVACVGILVNLSTLSLLFTISPHKGWTQSGVANVVSTLCNFFFHNLWTFADRQHQGVRLIRGFLSFALMSSAGILITTGAYVGFMKIAANLAIAKSHVGGLGIVLICQFFAILIGGFISYLLNWQFTWAKTKENSPAENSQVQEI
jgi:putative flippase GtrA